MTVFASHLRSSGSSAYIIFLATIVAISGFLLGFDTAIINGVLLILRSQLALSNFATQAAGGALLLGCLLGAASASLVGDRFGRRNSLLLSALLFLASTAATAMAGSIMVFSLGRLASGIAIGLASVLTPVYIAEVAPAHSRGRLVSMNQLAVVTGILIAYLVGWRLASWGADSWRWMVGIAVLPGAVFLLGLLAIPESPRWLIGHGQGRKGREILARIFTPEEAEEQAALIESASTGQVATWAEVFARPMHKALVVALGLAILCQITGVNAVLYYGSILITEHLHGQSTSSALAASVFIGSANLLVTLLAMRFIDRWGRRTMLLTAAGGMSVSLLLLVAAFSMPAAPTMLLLVSILGYIGFFAFGMGPVPWVVISEIFPNRVRGRAASVATSALWAGALLVTLTFLSLIRSLGVAGTFAVCASLSVFSFVFIWKLVPETRGKTLEQIQQEWRA
jgi:sugar porter (SP) family MFS transporter